MDNFKLGVRVSWVTVGINIILGIFKLWAGVLGRSNAMIADSMHTFSDIFTTILVLVGFDISTKEARDQDSIHKKYELLFKKLFGIIMIMMGSFVVYDSLKLLIFENITRPSNIALVAAIISIIVKEIMYWYTIKISRKIKSLSMEADAWHHREDAFSSIATFIAILSSKSGLAPLDAIAAIVVSIIVIRVGVDLYNKSKEKPIDESITNEIINNLETMIYDSPGVLEIKSLKSRLFNNGIYIDLDIFVDSTISVKEGHDIAESLQYKIENDLSNIKHCMVRIVPNNK